MSQLAFPPVDAPTPSRSFRRRTVRAVRPSLIDLRFKGDPWVVDNRNGTASLCLGTYSLLHIAISPLDLPGLNRALGQLRLGQARRLCEQRRGN